jgi:hypothetical protein
VGKVMHKIVNKLFFLSMPFFIIGCENLRLNPISPSNSSFRKSPEVWIHPNLGSADYLKMFTPEGENEWPQSRDIISTFQFHQGNLISNCVTCEVNTYDKLIENRVFEKVNGWGKLISFEAGAFKYHGGICAQSVSYLINDALNAISTVRAGGGSVSYISMDEPFVAGLECNFSEDKTAELVKDFIRAMPVQVGLTEAYPTFGPEEMKKNIEALERFGVKLPFVHLDVDRYATQRPGNSLSNANGYNVNKDLREMRQFLRQKGIVMGIIIWGEDGNSSEGFSADAILMSRQILNALGSDVDRLIFESWSPYLPSYPVDKRIFPLNLPETEPGTLTNLVLTESRRYGR